MLGGNCLIFLLAAGLVAALVLPEGVAEAH
jgi:hypothetical protein